MGRPLNPDLTKYWKICLPATLAGTVELYLFDRLHNKPKYGERGKLITSLLENWVNQQKIHAAREAAPNLVETLKAIRLEIDNLNEIGELKPAVGKLDALIASIEPSKENTDA